MNWHNPLRRPGVAEVKVEGNQVLITPDYQEALDRDARGLGLPAVWQQQVPAYPVQWRADIPRHGWGA